MQGAPHEALLDPTITRFADGNLIVNLDRMPSGPTIAFDEALKSELFVGSLTATAN